MDKRQDHFFRQNGTILCDAIIFVILRIQTLNHSTLEISNVVINRLEYKRLLQLSLRWVKCLYWSVLKGFDLLLLVSRYQHIAARLTIGDLLEDT